jgi:hypothetical protein
VMRRMSGPPAWPVLTLRNKRGPTPEDCCPPTETPSPAKSATQPPTQALSLTPPSCLRLRDVSVSLHKWLTGGLAACCAYRVAMSDVVPVRSDRCGLALRAAAGELPDQPVLIVTQAANDSSRKLARRLGFHKVSQFEEFDARQVLAVAPLGSFRASLPAGTPRPTL